MIRSGILVFPCPYKRMMSLGILLLMLGLTCLSSVIPSWICSVNSLLLLWEKLQLSPPQKYLFLFYSFGPQPITSPVYRIISWCLMCLLFRTSDSAIFLLEIQATCTLMSITLTFGMCIQNLELRGMEPATKFCNWIRRSSWEYKYFLFWILFAKDNLTSKALHGQN